MAAQTPIPSAVQPTAAVRSLPSYLLYGEQGGAASSERLHVETISSRSRLHDWEIQPHRHDTFFQILYMAQGQAEARLDSQVCPLRGPCAVCVPALVAHGFRFDPGVEGHVVTVQERHLASLLDAVPGLWARLAQPHWLALRGQGPAARSLGAAVAMLAAEYANPQPWRALALDAALLQTMVSLARALPDDAPVPAAGAGRAADHLARYRALIDARFRLQPRVADLAAELGLTPTQLNRICQRVLGRSALALLHDRLMLEAQRQLTYTTLSIKRIGLDLGFTDAGYFTRFFQRLSGLAPGAWREQAQR
ncbi:MAG: AraC family transcriptional regulator [Burkholderiales bacterium PBB6]|nr:MAG: AraC family transcriptional regulator [Burkholderiales bacterium PBB6]